MTDGFGGAALRIAGKLVVGGAVLAGAVHFASPVAQAPVVAATPAPAAPPVAATIATPGPVAAAAPFSAVTAAAADTPFVVKRIMSLDGPLRHGDYAWDETGVPQGPLIVTVDIAAEVLSVFRDGYEIGTAAIVYGFGDKPTPLGTFPIIQKDAHHVSSLYDAPMPYMMRLTNDGVAIHGSLVEWNAATHGCIGVPTPFAKLLFDRAKLGDRVIITNGKRLAMGQAIAT